MQFESRGMDNTHLTPSLHQQHGQTFHDGAQPRPFAQAIAGPFYETMTGPGNHPPSSFAFSHHSGGNYMGFMGGFPYQSPTVPPPPPPVHNYGGGGAGHGAIGPGPVPPSEAGSSPWTPGNHHTSAEPSGNYYTEAAMGASAAVDLTRQTPEFRDPTPNESEHTPKSQSSTDNPGIILLLLLMCFCCCWCVVKTNIQQKMGAKEVFSIDHSFVIVLFMS